MIMFDMKMALGVLKRIKNYIEFRGSLSKAKRHSIMERVSKKYKKLQNSNVFVLSGSQ